MPELPCRDSFSSNPVWIQMLGLEGEIQIHVLFKFNSRPLLPIFPEIKTTQKLQQKSTKQVRTRWNMDTSISYRIRKCVNMFNRELMKMTKTGIPNIAYENRDL